MADLSGLSSPCALDLVLRSVGREPSTPPAQQQARADLSLPPPPPAAIGSAVGLFIFLIFLGWLYGRCFPPSPDELSRTEALRREMESDPWGALRRAWASNADFRAGEPMAGYFGGRRGVQLGPKPKLWEAEVLEAEGPEVDRLIDWKVHPVRSPCYLPSSSLIDSRLQPVSVAQTRSSPPRSTTSTLPTNNPSGSSTVRVAILVAPPTALQPPPLPKAPSFDSDWDGSDSFRDVEVELGFAVMTVESE